jgi:hypothetical protein
MDSNGNAGDLSPSYVDLTLHTEDRTHSVAMDGEGGANWILEAAGPSETK